MFLLLQVMLQGASYHGSLAEISAQQRVVARKVTYTCPLLPAPPAPGHHPERPPVSGPASTRLLAPTWALSRGLLAWLLGARQPVPTLVSMDLGAPANRSVEHPWCRHVHVCLEHRPLRGAEGRAGPGP